MNQSRAVSQNGRRFEKFRRNSSAPVKRGSSNDTGSRRSSGLIFLVILAGLLLSCNVIWMYYAERTTISVCNYEAAYWGIHDSNDSSSRLDYQKVQGSGLRNIQLPLDIPNNTVLLGPESSSMEEGRGKLRFMTVGISSVNRKENYLFKTLDSIISQTSEEEKRNIYIYLLLADADPNIRAKRANAIAARYHAHIDSGLIRVLQPPSSIYPSINFAKIHRTYGDSLERVQWRTKQVLDFAFLFWYAYVQQPSVYYLLLEDDVLSAKHFVSAARDFVEVHKQRRWVALQLAGFLGIGQLVRCRDLDRLVSFLLLFYTEHPVDMLFNHWVSLMVPDKTPKDRPYRRVPGLFQHIGVHSTLANKIQRSKDNTFSLIKRRFSHINPEAAILTTIKQYKSFLPELAYSSAPGMFWGMPKVGDTFDIVFSQPVKIKRLFISTGTNIQNKKKTTIMRDKLSFGHVEISSEFIGIESTRKATCKDFKQLTKFEKGEVDFVGFSKASQQVIQCVRIVVDDQQKTWVAISEIAVFVVKETISTSNEISTKTKNTLRPQ